MLQEPLVIFENDSFIVLDKPSGYITNEADTTTNQPVVQTWLKNIFNYPLSQSYALRSGVVHRLDKETSGILLIAKTEESFNVLQQQFKDRVVKKTYIALTHGRVMPPEGSINISVGRLPWRRDRFGVLPGGRDSETGYKAIQYYKFNQETLTLVEFFPKTGRTHQIRIHAKYISHPIFSDDFYAGRKTSRNDRVICPRLFLHASSISFNDPITGEPRFFRSEIPQDLKNVLVQMENLDIK